jgi:3-deoxy-D-manno-octulosonic-acid transferase
VEAYLEEAAPSPKKTGPWSDPFLIGMNLAGIAISPFLAVHKLRRYVAYRNVDEINPERWWIKPVNPKATAAARALPGPHVMIVGASFGELLLMERVTEELEAKLGPVGISWVLRDRETMRQAERFHPDRSLAYWPFDSLYPVQRLLTSMRPDLMVMTERYRAANLVVSASRSGVSTVLINGRWRRRPPFVEGIQRGFARKLLGSFRALLFQSQTHLDSAKPLLNPDQVVKITGDLKYDLRQKELDPAAAASLQEWLGDGPPILAAGSTDVPAEEEMVLCAFLAVREETPCRLLLAPRRLNRRDEILKMLERHGLKASLRSAPIEGADVFVLDTMGELAWAYRYSVATYVGGSFSGMGHNVIEPVGYGLPVTYGMRRGHFESMQKLCERHGVGFRVADAAELSAIWKRAILDQEFASGVRAKGAALVEAQRGAMRTTVDALEAEIVALRKRGGRAA